MKYAYMHYDDGCRWLRIQDDDGQEWEEPITGWSLIFDLCRGGAAWFEHKDGRKFVEGVKYES